MVWSHKHLGALLTLLLLGAPGYLRAGEAGLININGPIGPATAAYISRAIDEAAANKDECLIIQLDTPGGLLDSTKEIVEKLFADPVPTVVYVTPSGATAASAGTFITLAADFAVMAPHTSIGAAHPVSLTGGDSGETTNSIMAAKLESYASSYIENIAAKRNHNVDWAKSSVRESASITADQAVKLGVINFIAKDVPDLLRQLDGKSFDNKTLHTASVRVVEIPMMARERVFQLLWRPEVMFILMLVAIYGIIGELSHPGAILPGVAGALALVLSLYMTAILPVNAAGLALIFLALVLFVIDVFAPTHGVLTGGGIIAFFLGSVMLFKPGTGYGLSLALVTPATLLTGAFFLFVVGKGLRAQRLPVKTGRESMPGKTAIALTEVNQKNGRVFVEGENWGAVSRAPISEGQDAEIVAVRGLTLEVKPK